MSKPSKKVLYRRELCAAMALALPISSMAAITPASGGPSVTTAGTDKVPIVQIVAPNGAGVSHNKFDQFDVGSQGVVLNNATAAAASQLAGQITANSNLANGAASVIITEVTGDAASQLNGAMEVAGKKAAIVVANPNGINADGLSFINASRATLSTGAPVLQAKDSSIPAQFQRPEGTLTGLRITKGVINVTGNGIDASGVEIADLFARTISLNAALKTDKLTVVTGPTVASYGMNGGSIGTSKAIAGEGVAPELALDVGALGSMYANAIRMEGTETGVGVNVAGKISAANQINLNTGGSLVIAKGGEVSSQGATNLKVGTHVFNAGTIGAGAFGVSIESAMPNFSATLDSKDGKILAPTGQVVFKKFGHKRIGELTSKNKNTASDDNGNTLHADSLMQDGNGTMATLPSSDTKPAGDTKPADEAKPAGDTKPADEAKPAGDTKPADEAKPAGDTKPVEPPKPAQDPVAVFVNQLLEQIFSRPVYDYAPSYGYVSWNRPSYGYSAWNAPSYGFSPWMPQAFRPQPVFSPYRPMAYGFQAPRWR